MSCSLLHFHSHHYSELTPKRFAALEAAIPFSSAEDPDGRDNEDAWAKWNQLQPLLKVLEDRYGEMKERYRELLFRHNGVLDQASAITDHALKLSRRASDARSRGDQAGEEEANELNEEAARLDDEAEVYDREAAHIKEELNRVRVQLDRCRLDVLECLVISLRYEEGATLGDLAEALFDSSSEGFDSAYVFSLVDRIRLLRSHLLEEDNLRRELAMKLGLEAA